MSKDYLDKWEETAKKNTEIIEQQQTKTKMKNQEQEKDPFISGLLYGIGTGLTLGLMLGHLLT